MTTSNGSIPQNPENVNPSAENSSEESFGKDVKQYAKGDKDSVKMLTEMQDILQKAVLLDTEISAKNSSKKHINTAFMHKLYAPVLCNRKEYVAKIDIEEYFEQGNSRRRVYHLEGIKIESADGSFSDNSGTSPRSDTDSIYSIADLFDFVKRYDSDFKPIPVNKDLLNADGTPKLFYHGAKNGGGFSEFRDWSYFTENRAYAERHSQKNTEATRLPQGAKAPSYLRVAVLLRTEG